MKELENWPVEASWFALLLVHIHILNGDIESTSKQLSSLNNKTNVNN